MKGKVLLASLVLVLTGCASTSDLDALNTRVENLALKVDNLAIDQAYTKHYVMQAFEKANESNQIARDALSRVEQCNKEINKKLDGLFKHIHGK